MSAARPTVYRLGVPPAPSAAPRAPRPRSYASFNGGYNGASFSQGRSQIFDYTADHHREVGSYAIAELRRKARWFRKNMGLPRAVAKDIRHHAIGPGMFVIPSTGDDATDTAYWEYWSEVQKVADVSGRLSWYDYQGAKVDMKFFDGDAHTLLSLTETGFPQFQAVRSHNVGNFGIATDDERWVNGVKRSPQLRHLAYRVKTRDSARTIQAAFVLQAMLAEDVDQARGVTCLAHAISDLHDQLDILALEKATVKDHGRISRVITNRAVWEDDEDNDQLAADFLGDADSEDPAALDPSIPIEKIWGSEVIRLGQNERLEAFASNRPSPAFIGFLDWLGRNVTAGCAMPYEYSWNPAGITSAAQRAIQNRINACCAIWQRSEERDTTRFYQFVILAGIARGDIPTSARWWSCEVFPGAPEVTIDKGRDARSDIQLVQANLLTLKAYHARKGKYWKNEARQTAEEFAFYAGAELTHPSATQAQDTLGPATGLADRDNPDDDEDDDEKKKGAAA